MRFNFHFIICEHLPSNKGFSLPSQAHRWEQGANSNKAFIRMHEARPAFAGQQCPDGPTTNGAFGFESSRSRVLIDPE
jgi:hypothetical protein